MNKYIIVNGELYHADELYHYGVLGMKWGKRRAQSDSIGAGKWYRDSNKRRKEAMKEGKKQYKSDIKAAKQNYKKAEKEAFDEHTKTMEKIEKPYKKGQLLSDKDVAREIAADNKWVEKSKQNKAEYKQAKKDAKNKRTETYNKAIDKNRQELGRLSYKKIAKTALLGVGIGALSKGASRVLTSKGRDTSAQILSGIGDIAASYAVTLGVGTAAAKAYGKKKGWYD